MPALGIDTIATEAIAGEYLWGKPTVAITDLPEATTATPTYTFSFTAFAGRAQVAHQYRVSTLSGLVLYLSPELAADTSFTPDYLMADGTTYKVAVRAYDGHQWSDWSETTTAVTLDDPTDFPLNTSVGSVYEIAINGTGYMLADDPGERIIRRQAYAVEQPRFAVGSTPFAEAVDRYSFGAHSDWRGGAGQALAHRPDSIPNRYLDSWLIDPFQEGGFRLLHTITDAVPETALAPHAVVAGGELIVATADTETDELYYRQTDGTDGVFAITGATAGDCVSLVSDGYYWYYANGSDIWRGSGHADPGAADSSLNASLLCWAIDRLAAVYNDGSNNLCVTTFDNSLAEEVSGGRFKYPTASVTVPAMTAGDGFLWWLVNRTDQCQVHFWQVGSEDTFAANALTLPAGQKGISLFFYLGNVMVATVEEPGDGCTLRIYRCVPTDGELTPELVIERRLEAETADVKFTGVGRQILFTWPEYDPDDVVDGRVLGTGCFDLATGGWARWLAPAQTAGVESGGTIVSWNGQLVLAGDSETEGLYIETSSFESAGVLDNSTLDFASGIRKQAVEVSVTVDPLPSDTGAEGFVSISQGASYGSVGSLSTPGSRRGSWSFTKRFDSATIRVELTSDGTSTPVVSLIQFKVHPVATVDQLVQFPIRVSNDIRGLNGAPIPIGSLDRSGAAWAAHTLLSLSVGQRIQLQDVDWPHTQVTSIWEVVEVDSRLHGQFVHAENRRVDVGTVFLTLRRAS